MRTRVALVVMAVVLLGSFALPVGVAQHQLQQPEPEGRTLEMKSEEWDAVIGLGQGGLEMPELPAEDIPARTLYRESADGYVSGGEEFSRHVRVATPAQLGAALRDATPGDLIELESGRYEGSFELGPSGTEGSPTAIVGPRDAVITSGSQLSGTGLTVTGSHWRIAGLSIADSGDGVVLDGVSDVKLSGIEVSNVGGRGIDLRNGSHSNEVIFSHIHHTGQSSVGPGQAVRISSSARHPEGVNVVRSNVIGPRVDGVGVSADSEAGGLISENTFSQMAATGADPWIRVSATGYTVTGNRGAISPHQPDSWEFVVSDAAGNVVADNSVFESPGAIVDAPRFVAGVPGGTPTLLLPGRVMPYTLGELMARFPRIAASADGEALLLGTSIFAGPQATLDIHSSEAPLLRLRSDRNGHVAIAGYAAELQFTGAVDRPIVVESWDQGEQSADRELSDGRAYVLAVGGEMNVTRTEFSRLGYEEGTVSGVAWKGLSGDEGMRVRGRAEYSLFRQNYFGAYTFEAQGMVWRHNSFLQNEAYGFDPHDFSNDFVFEHNVASGNGSHGIIFSRGCHRNLIRFNTSVGNDGHGIMIDDGKHLPESDDPRYQEAVPSNSNVIEHNHIEGNLDGIVLEGGEGNIVTQNEIVGEHRYGIRLKDDVTGTVASGNEIESASRVALYIYNDSNGNHFEANTFGTAPLGLAVEQSTGNEVVGNRFGPLTRTAIAMTGTGSLAGIEGNVFVGSGSDALVADPGAGTSSLREANDLSNWHVPAPFGVQVLGLGVWGLTFLVPMLVAMVARAHYDLLGSKVRRGRHRRTAPFLRHAQRGLAPEHSRRRRSFRLRRIASSESR